MRKGLAVGTLLLALAMPASAQDAANDALTITAVNVTARDAEREDLTTTLAGDVVEYTLEFTNPQPVELTNIVLEDPIPTGLVYQIGSATSDQSEVVIDFSINGGQSWSEAPVINGFDDAGNPIVVPAPDTSYTHVRWTFTGSIAPGATVTGQFRTYLPAPEGAGGDR